MKALALALWLGASSALAAPLAVPLGDDGLHKPDWLEESFLDLREDLEEAQAGGAVFADLDRAARLHLLRKDAQRDFPRSAGCSAPAR
ncbi:hypothetical protein ACFOHK_00885 [Falsigemmobacter intermedius]|uniref:hypothetical protein n=1 Tax=Falsigemmobacter intermedius TaxID=1553448 RepID=UPI003609296C